VQTSSGRSRLVRVLGAQIQARADNLPEGTTQRVFIDIRGQELSPADRTALAQQIADNSGGAIAPEDVTFMRR
jgi:filamentous hemagglutinin